MFSNKERALLMAEGTVFFTATEAAREGKSFSDFLGTLTSRMVKVEKIADDVEQSMESKQILEQLLAAVTDRKPSGQQPEASKVERGEDKEPCDCALCTGSHEGLIAALKDGDTKVEFITLEAGSKLPPELAALLAVLAGKQEG